MDQYKLRQACSNFYNAQLMSLFFVQLTTESEMGQTSDYIDQLCILKIF